MNLTFIDSKEPASLKISELENKINSLIRTKGKTFPLKKIKKQIECYQQKKKDLEEKIKLDREGKKFSSEVVAFCAKKEKLSLAKKIRERIVFLHESENSLLNLFKDNQYLFRESSYSRKNIYLNTASRRRKLVALAEEFLYFYRRNPRALWNLEGESFF